METTRRGKQSLKCLCAFAAMVVARGTFAATALIPAPREMDVQGGECQVKAPTKVEAVATISPNFLSVPQCIVHASSANMSTVHL